MPDPIAVPAGEPQAQNPLAWLAGKKTYILAGLGVVVIVLQITGVIPDEAATRLLELLGVGTAATIRAAIAKTQ